MRRAFAFATVLALGVTALAAAPSCSTETAAVIDTGCPATGTTPKLTIASPAEGACVEVSAGKDAYIPVVVIAENFKLDPPGTCNECESCGHLQLDVNGQYNNSAATSIVDVVFQGKIASRYGELELKVTLVGEDGAPWAPAVDGGTGDAGDAGQTAVQPVTATVKVITAKSCAASGSSSSGTTSSSSGGTGGAGGAGTGGAGGATSSSSGGTGGTGGTGGMGTGGMGTGGTGGKP